MASVGLIASVLTSYTKARAEAIDVPMAGGFIERGERVVLIVAGGVLGFMEPALWILAVGATATVIQRFDAARKGFDRLGNSSSGPSAPGRPVAHGE